jgi:hypothetical protein
MDDAAPSAEIAEEPSSPAPSAPSVPAVIDQIRAIAGAAPGAKSFAIRGESGEIRVLYGTTFTYGIELRAPFPEVEGRGSAGGAYRQRTRPVVDVKRPLAIYLRKEAASDLDDEDGSVHVHYVFYPGEEKDKDPERGRRIVDAFDRLMGALPQLKTIGRDGRLVRGWMVMLAWPAALAPGAVLFFTMRPPECRPREDDVLLHCSGGTDCCEPVVAGLCAGGALAIALGLLIWKTVRGKSNSSTMQRVWMILSTGLSLELGVLLARLLW